DRQNNPEIELNEAQFIALERDKSRERTKSLNEAEQKAFCPGPHSLTYGAWQERQEAEVEKITEIQQNQAPDKVAELENQLEKEKEGG
ncbi:6651_t:CDS:1, partial [Racocetra persica]